MTSFSSSSQISAAPETQDDAQDGPSSSEFGFETLVEEADNDFELPTENTAPENDISQSQPVVANAPAPTQPAIPTPPPFELPEIDSDSSDSDDEERLEAFPSWAQDPVLLQAWEKQRTIDPDDVFGGVDWSSRMDELFRWKGRQTECQVNWGEDALTVEEEREYARIMGYW